ncbi:hypothetical protein TOK_3603 [Pseudonocardia sp. N23]|nr:hypothetical protein TOK_3603 [Pseudonocardia sp. N23]
MDEGDRAPQAERTSGPGLVTGSLPVPITPGSVSSGSHVAA